MVEGDLYRVEVFSEIYSLARRWGAPSGAAGGITTLGICVKLCGLAATGTHGREELYETHGEISKMSDNAISL
jgi:hypothetical protein